MPRTVTTGIAVLVVTAALGGWLLAAESVGSAPSGAYRPFPERILRLTGPDASARRSEMLVTATARYLDEDPLTLHEPSPLAADDPLQASLPECRFLAGPPTGTSAKFDCVFDGGEVVKVKYGRNSEIHAEAAATRLLSTLGYAADTVVILPKLRCYGCPRFPFATMKVLTRAKAIGLLSPNGYDRGFTDFEWVGVERKFPAPAIVTDADEGWAWWELARSRAPRDELDAFRLLAVFLAHWDNKADNQRLVCVDAQPVSHPCARPVLMMQDVGATFGPTKVNLARWHDLPVWTDRRSCSVSMKAMPFHGGTFPDAQISDAGRSLLAQRLARLSDDDIRSIFEYARFPEFHTGTDDERDLAAWVAAFKHRAQQVADAGPCVAE